MNYLFPLLLPIILIFFMSQKRGGMGNLGQMFGNMGASLGSSGPTPTISFPQLWSDTKDLLLGRNIHSILIISIIVACLVTILTKRGLLVAIPELHQIASFVASIPLLSIVGSLKTQIVAIIVLAGALLLMREIDHRESSQTIIIGSETNGLPGRAGELRADIKKLRSPMYQNIGITAIIGILFGFGGIFGWVILQAIVLPLISGDPRGRYTGAIRRRSGLYTSLTRQYPNRRKRSLGALLLLMLVDIPTLGVQASTSPLVNLLAAFGLQVISTFLVYTTTVIHRRFVAKK